MIEVEKAMPRRGHQWDNPETSNVIGSCQPPKSDRPKKKKKKTQYPQTPRLPEARTVGNHGRDGVVARTKLTLQSWEGEILWHFATHSFLQFPHPPSPQSPPSCLNSASRQLCRNLGMAAHRKQPSQNTGAAWEKERQMSSGQHRWEEKPRYETLYIQFMLYMLEQARPACGPGRLWMRPNTDS